MKYKMNIIKLFNNYNQKIKILKYNMNNNKKIKLKNQKKKYKFLMKNSN